MTARNYHTPPQPGSTRVRCPVCHEAVYSRAGIHPQCAVRQSEPPKVKATPQAAPVVLAADVPADVEPEEVSAEVVAAGEIAAEEIAPAVEAKVLPRPARVRPTSGRRQA